MVVKKNNNSPPANPLTGPNTTPLKIDRGLNSVRQSVFTHLNSRPNFPPVVNNSSNFESNGILGKFLASGLGHS